MACGSTIDQPHITMLYLQRSADVCRISLRGASSQGAYLLIYSDFRPYSDRSRDCLYGLRLLRLRLAQYFSSSRRLRKPHRHHGGGPRRLGLCLGLWFSQSPGSSLLLLLAFALAFIRLVGLLLLVFAAFSAFRRWRAWLSFGILRSLAITLLALVALLALFTGFTLTAPAVLSQVSLSSTVVTKLVTLS